MLFTKATKSDLNLYRVLFLVAGISYFLFWFILKKVEPDCFDPLLGRALVSISILLVLLLTYFSNFFKDYVIAAAYTLAYILTIYYIFLLTKNYFSYTYSIGLMTILIGTVVVFKESKPLLVYLAFCLFSVCVGYVYADASTVPFILYISILGVTSIIAYLTMSIRLNIQQELNLKNIYLNRVYQEIDEQKKIVELKNLDITDSIVYAKKIQHAIIPDKDGIKDYLPDSFIYYRVKDIVSGDFYWYHKKEGGVYIAAVDCTGHGVPGALLSMIGLTLLKQTVELQHKKLPGDILSNMQKEIFSFLQRGSSDGMDISLCSIDFEKNVLSFAGAMMRMLMVRDGVITEIRGDRHSISRNTSFDATFSTHHIPYKKGDAFYIFTDGYIDQFGGEKNKKFMFRRFEKMLLDLHHLPMWEQKSKIESIHKSWRGDQEQVDDILVIGFKL